MLPEKMLLPSKVPASGQPHCALMLSARITFPHFSISSAMNLLKSAGEPGRTVPRPANRALIWGSARPALTSRRVGEAIAPSAASTHGASALNIFDEVLRFLQIVPAERSPKPDGFNLFATLHGVGDIGGKALVGIEFDSRALQQQIDFRLHPQKCSDPPIQASGCPPFEYADNHGQRKHYEKEHHYIFQHCNHVA
jgi:hypothetical protein